MHIQFLENPVQGRYGAMEGRNQAGKQFDRLYRQFLPRLYQGALYLLGSREAAAQAAEAAWLRAFSDRDVSDTRAFWFACASGLVSACAKLRPVPYRAAEILEAPTHSQAQLLSALAGMDYSLRELVVLTGVLGFSPEAAARLLQIPRTLALSRLQRVAAQLAPAGVKRVPAA